MTGRVGIIVQARMGSSRLPGKVMKLVGSIPIIELLLRRLSRVKRCDIVIVATTTDPKDDPLIDHCRTIGATVFRGPEQDVLARYYQAAKAHGLDIVVRITGDCPLADPALIDEMIEEFIELEEKGQADYLNNTLEQTYPRGLDVEVFTFKALEKAYSEAKEGYQREHVTPYIWENGSLFKVVGHRADEDNSAYRLTVDTQEDLDLILAIEKELSRKGIEMVRSNLDDILQVLRDRPELVSLNKGVRQKSHKEVDERNVRVPRAVKGKSRSARPMALFRTNASSRIGMGHLTRCIALGEEMVARGWDVQFMVRGAKTGDPYSIVRRLTKGLTVLPASISQAKELDVLRRVIEEKRPTITVVDSYEIDGKYLEAVRGMGRPVAYFDDWAKVKSGMDLLVNYNVGFDRSEYRGLKLTKLLLGPKYCPLNRSVRERRSRMKGPPEQPEVARDILLTLGGGEHTSIYKTILKAISQEDWIRTVRVPTTRIKGLKDRRFQFIGFQKDLPSVIARHPLTITAGGTTCYQLACLGVPSLIFVLVENQSRTAKGLEQLGIGRDLGTARPLDRKAFIEVLHDLAHDRKSRQRMAKNAFNAVDNKGTARIVDLIEEEFI